MDDKRGRLAGYLIALGVLAADQVTKIMVLGWLDPRRPVEVAGDFLRFTLVWNRGAAFSLSWGGPVILTVVTGAAAVFVCVLIWRMADRPRPFLAGMGAILGGALGNLIDRFMYGSVLDFIDVGLAGRRWPTFNVADVAITAGGIILLILYMRETRAERAEGKRTDGGD